MWCIPKLTKEFIKRMEDLLMLYAKPYNPQEPVICFDEKSKELHADSRPYKKMKKGSILRRDYEYTRNGTANIFLTVEPKGGYRHAHVTKRRTKKDFAFELRRIISLARYRTVKTLHVVLDNLNTHYEPSLIETLGKEKTASILKNVLFHYTPKHASWLNMAEIEIGVMSQQAIKGRVGTREKLRTLLTAWQRRRNKEHATINWKWTTKDARKKFGYRGRKLS